MATDIRSRCLYKLVGVSPTMPIEVDHSTMPTWGRKMSRAVVTSHNNPPLSPPPSPPRKPVSPPRKPMPERNVDLEKKKKRKSDDAGEREALRRVEEAEKRLASELAKFSAKLNKEDLEQDWNDIFSDIPERQIKKKSKRIRNATLKAKPQISAADFLKSFFGPK